MKIKLTRNACHIRYSVGCYNVSIKAEYSTNSRSCVFSENGQWNKGYMYIDSYPNLQNKKVY